MTVAFLFLVLAIIVLVVALYVLIGVFVYRDAKRRGMNAVLWTAIAVLVPSLIGIIIYLLARNSMPEGTLCARCSSPVENSFLVCPKCGQELAAPCPACGKQVSREWRLCPYCKAELPTPQPTVKAPWRASPALIVAIVALVVLVFVSLFAALVVIPQFAYQSSGVQIGAVENNSLTDFSDNFMYFDGEKSHAIHLESGQTLTINADISVESGSISTDITDPAGNTSKSIDGSYSDLIVIKAEQAGDYTIHMKMSKAKGHYSFSWTIQ